MNTSATLDNRFFKIAYKAAKKHLNTYDEKMLAYHSCVIVKGGKIVAIGTNSEKRNSFVAKHYKENYIGVHAECDAVAKICRKIDLNNCKAYILRIRPNGALGLSKPCENCERLLKLYGIKKVYYSLNDSSFESEKY